ncbi:unnamed protein product [Rotaria sordida]|uniref:Uncharacterized protein n=1 Tax=Rotaria sordida TaxID=392033 RepID=A0A814HSI5_9BILA|nr:unnamed protein product [Rotaria sordida]
MESSYWKHKNASSAVPTLTSHASKKGIWGIELHDVWITDNLSPPDHRVPPIPSFYKRIFPVHTPPCSIQPSTTISQNKLRHSKPTMHVASSNIPNERHNNDTNDSDDISPYAVDSQGIAHYRELSSPSDIMKSKAIAFSSSSSPTHNPVTSTYTTNTTPLQQKYAMTPTPFTSNVTSQVPVANTVLSSSTTNSGLLQSSNFLNSASYSPNNYPSSTMASSAVLTLDELSGIQSALRLLEANPNAIPTIETYQ